MQARTEIYLSYCRHCAISAFRGWGCRLVMQGVAMLMADAAWLVFRIVENQAYTSKGAYSIGNLVHWYLPLLDVEGLQLYI